MKEDICPICKHVVRHLEPFATLTALGRTRVYHEECYWILLERLDSLWKILTGPKENFLAWLAEEEEPDE